MKILPTICWGRTWRYGSQFALLITWLKIRYSVYQFIGGYECDGNFAQLQLVYFEIEEENFDVCSVLKCHDMLFILGMALSNDAQG